MKNQDSIEKLFEKFQDSFDTENTPVGHQQRFLEKLKAQQPVKKPISWWKPLSIAASVLLLLGVGFFGLMPTKETDGLASVSSEMEKTQSFFVTTINQEIETLKSFQDEDTQHLVQDALKRLELLQQDYENLKVDLVESGNDKRVVAAMIANFQNRIDILEQVFTTMEEIKTLKTNTHETPIQNF
ncbi:MAG: hypothetical protein R2776_07755 [Flavobacteriaceae bacterium]|nr:hypothetical protein [Flavobacteriaceae bacterium]